MLEKFRFNPFKFEKRKKIDIEPDQETLEQKIEVVETPFDIVQFRKMKDLKQKLDKKMADSVDKADFYKKITDFAIYLRDKYSQEEASKYAMYHMVIFSTFDEGDGVIYVDFPGDDSVENFIEKL